MATGFLAGMVAYATRETADGRLVASRQLLPFVKARWRLVPADARARFERRVMRANVAMVIAVVIIVNLLIDRLSIPLFLLSAIEVGLVTFPVMQYWTTAGLPEYDGDASTLVAVPDSEGNLRQARAMGTRGVTAFLILSIILALPQLFVAVFQDFAWGWIGVVMFGGSAIHFARMLRILRSEQRSVSAT